MESIEKLSYEEAANDHETPQFRCLLHYCGAADTCRSSFTKVRWKTFVEWCERWSEYAEEEADIVINCKQYLKLEMTIDDYERLPPNVGFHAACYRKFIDRKRFSAARKRQSDTVNDDIESNTVMEPDIKRLRSHSEIKQRERPVLPEICIICQKAEKFITIQHKRNRDKLMQAETKDGGQLRKAATRKKDEDILMHIRNKDCVALELHYHRSCYRSYVRSLEEDDNASRHREEKPDQAYDRFCAEVIVAQIIQGQGIYRMNKLIQLYQKMVQDYGPDNISHLRKDQLKYRLQRDYPQLSFHPPVRKNQSEVVYCEAATALNILGSDIDSSEISSSFSEHDHLPGRLQNYKQESSTLYGKGKKKAYNILRDNAEFLQTFSCIGRNFSLSEDVKAVVEKFVCTLYGQTQVMNVNEARYRIFCVSSSQESLPPTQDELYLHLNRVNYQAAIHKHCLKPIMDAPSPTGYGWEIKDEQLNMIWMTKAPAPDKLLEVVHCGCKSSKCTSGRCSCLKAGVSCTDLCKCSGCSNIKNDKTIHNDVQDSSGDESDTNADDY